MSTETQKPTKGMEVIAILSLFELAIGMVEKLSPVVQQLASSGTIPPEQQQALKDRVDKLRNSAAFSGPEWQKSTGG